MNNDGRLGWMAIGARLCAVSALVGVFAIGCTNGDGGSGGSTASGGAGGTTSSGGNTSTGGSGGSTSVGGDNGGAGPSACELAMPNRFWVGMDVHETGKAWVPPNPAEPASTLSWSGTVTSTGVGISTENCGFTPPGANGAWLSLVDADGKSWTACYLAPDASMPVQTGDAVDLSLQMVPGYLNGLSLALTVRKDGALRLLVHRDNNSVLSLPDEINVVDGEEICQVEDEYSCLNIGHRAVVSAGGAQETLLPGETGIVGAYEVHLGWWDDVEANLSCEAGNTNHQLFVVPVPLP